MKAKKGTKPNKKQNSKSQSKRLKTFNSSQFSLLQDRHQLSTYDFRIFKNQGIAGRRQNCHSALSQYGSVKPQVQKKKVVKKKKIKQKGKSKQKKQSELYEHIKYEDISNKSEIVFSNEETKRTSSVLVDKRILKNQIQLQDTYHIDSNKMLRLTIRKQYQQKIEAATKIQKVFRGYMTRKILMKYVKNEEERILKKLFQKSRRQEKVDSDDQFEENHASSEERTFRDIPNFHKLQIQSQRLNHAIRPRLEFSDEKSSESEESEQLGYRHKQAVYSHEQISKFLDESSEQYDGYEPDIIFETNDEYLDSRKSSLQNKNETNNELSKHVVKQKPLEKFDEKQEQISQSSEQEDKDKSLIKSQIKEESSENNFEGQLKENTEQNQDNENENVGDNIENQITYRSEEYEQRQFSEVFEDVQKLKQEQKQKWDEVIDMITGQIKNSNQSNKQALNFMKKILQMSLKNKQFLDSTQSVNLQTTLDVRLELENRKNDQGEDKIGDDEEQEDESEKLTDNSKLFRKKKLMIDIPKTNQVKVKEGKMIKKNICEEISAETCPVPHKQSFHKQFEKKLKDKDVLFENTTGKIKTFISSNLQDDTINEMLKIRQQLLEQRESEQLFKLNEHLKKKSLTQEQFLSKLQGMTKKFIKQKQTIDKARDDIEKGYKAAMNLVKQSFYDAKRLGFKLSMSRSQDNLKYKNPKAFVNELMVDQITPKSKKSIKDIFLQEQKKEEDSDHNSSIDFTEEELQRFRKLQSSELNELNYLNKNMVISEDFFKQQQANATENEKEMRLKREVYQVEEQARQRGREQNKEVNIIVQKQEEYLIYEFVSEIIMKPLMVDKFIDRSQIIKPVQITKNERQRFIQIIQQNLPQTNLLQEKLNQKITPLPSEILKCMRLDFSDDAEEQQEEDNYQQISKYQFVISQDICAKSVLLLKNQLQSSYSIQNREEDKSQEIQNTIKVVEEGQFPESFKKFMTQRQKFIKNKKQHSKDLFWQVMNIQVHCIFDAWNQQIIQIRSEKAGFSGIGLNELTLSLVDHNRMIKQNKVQQILSQAKQSLKQTLDPDIELNAKILKQNFKEMCYTDSAWIFYADEALSYGLQLVYLIQQDLYKQVQREIKKIVMKQLFN